MGNLRPVLIIGLVFLGYMIWVQWQKDYGPAPQTQAPIAATQSDTPDVPVSTSAGTNDLPQPLDSPGVGETAAGLPEPELAQSTKQLISVTTDVLEVKIDPAGGTVVSAVLIDYPIDLDVPAEKVNLLASQGNELFIAQSGLLSHQEAPNHTTPYRFDSTSFQLSEGASELRVPMTWAGESGLEVTKTFIFTPGSYEISVSHDVRNGAGQTWSGSRYDQLQRSVPGDRDAGGFTNPGRYSFFGVGFYNPEDKFEKIDFDDLADEPFKKTSGSGWLAMVQHYFFAAWIPPAEEEAAYSTQVITGQGWPRYIAREVSPSRTVPAGGATSFSSRLYLGPKIQDELPDIAPGLEYTVNYGIFTVFSKPLFWLLEKIHDVVGNWGWAIVILTIFIKAAFFKLTEAQYRSTARMRKLQPRIEQLKERYGDDRQRMSQAMMELYKKEKVNPLGGCLPILVQIPIFIALYWVLLESVELRQAPFILWIDNLSVRDPYFILPLLNAAFMFATQRLTPMVGMDPLQQKMMQMMPLVFSVMFAFFPAGLVLYWATNAGLSLAQQYYITRKIAAAD
ncbi:MAG: membrane protein insertase YidC [Xanthomonadales bacterium]|nr:membrane protein insertase YidC [Xanthomonadales bacterium]NNK50774.1 membrane protein insertase YidC [Xanthomonadales bacterium]